jgi:hypothetical protein
LRIGFLILTLIVTQFIYSCKSNSTNEPIVHSGSITIKKELFEVQKIWALNGEFNFRLLQKDKKKTYLGFLIYYDGQPFEWRSWKDSNYSGMGLSSIQDRLFKVKGRGKIFLWKQCNCVIVTKNL